MSNRFRNPRTVLSLFAVFVALAFWGGRQWERLGQNSPSNFKQRGQNSGPRAGHIQELRERDVDRRIEISAVDETAVEDRSLAENPGANEAKEAFEALRVAFSEGGEFSWTLESYRLIGALKLEALPHFLKLTDSFRIPHIRHGIQNVVFERWSELEPEAAISLLTYTRLNHTLMTPTHLLPLNRTAVQRKALPVKVLQFGEGNFLRAFVDWIIHRMNQNLNFGGHFYDHRHRLFNDG